MTVGHFAELVLEDVERALYASLFAYLPGALTDIASEWAAKDTAFFTSIGATVPDTPLPPPALFLLGHHPSALDRDVQTEFPNVTVMAYNSRTADPEGRADQYEPVLNTVYAELFVADTDEDRINRRTKRYGQALSRVVTRLDPTLGGLTVQTDQIPEVGVSNTSARKRDQYTDQVWWVQGARLDYQFHVIQPW